jgi:hypothetical protein
MGQLVDPLICPECRTTLTSDARCPNCGLQFDGPLASELWATMQHADDLLTRIRQRNRPIAQGGPAAAPVPGTAPTSPSPPAQLPGSAPAPSLPVATKRPSPLSIPVILLALGGLCILVAALVFVAVAWGSIGIGGRTAILAVITVVMSAGAVLLTVKDLRWAAETFWVIVAGMLALDILGARAANLFGDDRQQSMQIAAPLLVAAMLVLGLVVGLWSARAATGQIISVQVSALIGVAIGNGLGFVGFDPVGVTPAVAIPIFAAIAIWSLKRVQVLAWGLVGLVVVNWLSLFGSGLINAAEEQSNWWTSLDWWPLALAGVYSVVATVPKLPHPVRVLAAGMSLLAWSVVILGPDGATNTQRAFWAALMIGFLSLLVASGARVWGRAAGITGVLWILPYLFKLYIDANQAADTNVILPSAKWSTPVFGDLFTAWWALLLLALAIAGILLAAHRLFPQPSRRTVLGATIPLAYLPMSLALIAISATIGAPLWAFVGILTVLLIGAIFVAWQVSARIPGLISSAITIWTLAGLTGMATLPNHSLAACSAVLVLVPVASYWYAAARAQRRPETMLALGAVPIIAFWAWIQFWLAAGWSNDLALAAAAGYGGLILLLARLAQKASGHEVDRNLTEVIGTLFIPIPALAFGSDHHALALSLAGAGLVLTAILNRDRELFGWFGAIALLAGAVAYDQDHVAVPERLSLPFALLLILAGWRRMQQEQSLGSVRALGAGVLLALTPSLVLALIDPITWRGAILFVTGVIILLVGAFTRWGMLFYAGTLVTAVMAIRYLGPWAQGIPRWVGIGIVGLLLLGLGVSWEFGRKNLRTASDYLRSLR